MLENTSRSQIEFSSRSLSMTVFRRQILHNKIAIEIPSVLSLPLVIYLFDYVIWAVSCSASCHFLLIACAGRCSVKTITFSCSRDVFSNEENFLLEIIYPKLPITVHGRNFNPEWFTG